MHLSRERSGYILAIVCLVIFISILSCNLPNLDFSEDVSSLEGTLTATVEIETKTASPAASLTFTQEPTATKTPIPFGPTMTPFAPPADSLVELTEEGPWLVYNARKELSGPAGLVSMFITNADGTGRSLLGPSAAHFSGVVVSPAGDRFAYIITEVEDDPHLVIRRVPSGEIEIDIPLISSEVKQTISDQEGVKEQILLAVGDSRALTWSPSGHYLAFIAALVGSDTDVYRFDTWSNNIRQLTTNSLNAYFPSWSPNGEWVVHLKGESIGGLEGPNTDGIWVVSPDGSSTERLYGAGSGIDYLVSWADGATFYSTYDTGSGFFDLIRRKLDGSTTEVMYVGPLAPLEQISFDDLKGVIAFNIRASDPIAEAGTAPGIYLISLSNRSVNLILPGDWDGVAWWPGKGVYIANGESGTAFIRRTGEVVKQMEDIVGKIAPSPEGNWMVSYGEDGAKVYTHIGVFIQQVYDGPVADVVWGPEDAGFFLEVYQPENPVIGHQLYRLDLTEWEMELIDLDTRGGYFWMEQAIVEP
jgi:hypothetical protein